MAKIVERMFELLVIGSILLAVFGIFQRMCNVLSF